ncbi:MAG: hypothetical protein J6U54_03960 [Clostridiales bacterium]|nr:hypothetical protein [Clostridiales bacterium]
MAIEIQTVWFIFFCVIIGTAEILWIRKIHRQNVAIKRRLAKLAENDFQSRWNWKPTPEESARLQMQCEESKRLIALYWEKRQDQHEESVRLSTILS